MLLAVAAAASAASTVAAPRAPSTAPRDSTFAHNIVQGRRHSDISDGKIDVFVSPSGDDTNSGTQREPLRSMKAARDLVRAQRSGSMGPGTAFPSIFNLNEF